MTERDRLHDAVSQSNIDFETRVALHAAIDAAPAPPPDALRAAIAEVARIHERGDWREEGWVQADDGRECRDDGEPWPCSAERLRVLAATTPSAPAEAPLDVVVERVAEAVEQSEYICDGYDFGTCPDALRAAIRAALAQQAEPRPEERHHG